MLCFYDSQFFLLKFKRAGGSTIQMRSNLPTTHKAAKLKGLITHKPEKQMDSSWELLLGPFLVQRFIGFVKGRDNYNRSTSGAVLLFPSSRVYCVFFFFEVAIINTNQQSILLKSSNSKLYLII
ncbi:hypothetical protein BT96DRAFT_548365 [Gymnopus androsaceus JB14]|uniref:Uncharacterized protein n=1 Tax=Gymnopus androsaceus JB14 TaxID=1447944 RepID=A0A6A4HTJ2_9AGAR|nr:hypothetical protein BT96DRAFT_548365 [Gymnopus androsaceus JB14]